ncbi:basic salivary proline-rich protein 3-like [Phacochoerus africanus]|uniref:basic salivary proline-rich protein 3-like n=1 Tax=Phacochoerus africanus TaxID=41426 RepID=UPI001FD8C46F|nr:basic salivary proline-rich protein 3-like [Phacochoerus africanus]
MGDEDRPRSGPGPRRCRVPSHTPVAGPTETRRARGVETPPERAPGSQAEREGPGGPGRGGKGEIRETSLSGRTRQTGFGQGRRSLQGGAPSGAPGVGGRAHGRERALCLDCSGLGWGVGNPEARAPRLRRAASDAAPEPRHRRESCPRGGSSALGPAQAGAPKSRGGLRSGVGPSVQGTLEALLQRPGSFRTFRPAPSPRPPFPGPPLRSLGPGGAARPERPREIGPGKPGGRREEAVLGEVVCAQSPAPPPFGLRIALSRSPPGSSSTQASGPASRRSGRPLRGVPAAARDCGGRARSGLDL